MTDSPSSAVSSGASTITFTYTAGCGLLAGGELQLDVPPGWPPPLSMRGSAGLVSSSAGMPVVSGRRITITGATLPPGGSLTIQYPTELPSSPATSTFPALEEAGKGGILTQLAQSPQFTVLPQTGSGGGQLGSGGSGTQSGGGGTQSGGRTAHVAGAGTMTVSPASVAAGRHATLTFTYTPPGSWRGGRVRIVLAIPRGWTPPARNRGVPGYVSASTDSLTASPMDITVVGRLKRGQRLSIIYHDAVVPAATGRVTFSARVARSGGGGLVALAPPSVLVTSLAALSSSGGSRTPVALLTGVLATACAAALGLGTRLLRLRGRYAPAARVFALGHPGPPGAMTVQPTTSEATLVVRVEPHPGAVSVRTQQVTR